MYTLEVRGAAVRLSCRGINFGYYRKQEKADEGKRKAGFYQSYGDGQL